MESLKTYLLKKLELCNLDGFTYDFEKGNISKTKLNDIPVFAVQDTLNSCYYAYSVGSKELFNTFLPIIILWGETIVKNGTSLKKVSNDTVQYWSGLYEAHAGATWLYTGQDNIDIWKECLAQTNLWFFEQRNPTDYSVCKGLDNQLFYTYLQRCLFAKEYQQGIAVYEHFKGNKPIKLTSKTGLVTLMYAILRHFQYGEFDKEKLNKTCLQVLDKELKHVYMKGRPDDAIYWLKTMCLLREKQYTPEEVVLTFYEFLEDEEIPDEIHKFLKQRGLFNRSDLIANSLL